MNDAAPPVVDYYADRAILRAAYRLHDAVRGVEPDGKTLLSYAKRLRDGLSLADLARGLASYKASLARAVAAYPTRFGGEPATGDASAETLLRLIEADPTVAAIRVLPINYPNGTSVGHGNHYRWWIEENDTLTDHDRQVVQGLIAAMQPRPSLTLVVPAVRQDAVTLAATLASIAAQPYPDLEALVVVARQPAPDIASRIAADPRFRLVEAAGSAALPTLFNAGLASAGGAFIGLVGEGDMLAETACFEAAAAIAADPKTALLYSDEDSRHPDGRRHSPILKTAWDPDAMLARDHIGRLALIDTSLVRTLGGMRPETGALAEYQLLLRAGGALAAEAVRHLPAVLYHRRTERQPWWRRQLARFRSASPTVPRARVVEQHLDEIKLTGCQVTTPRENLTRVVRPLPAAPPQVSIVIPTRDRLDLLRTCVDGLLNKTDYPALDLVIMDNDSREAATAEYFASLAGDRRVTVIRHPGDFNWSAINNRGVEAAKGEIVALLNNDIEIIASDWLREMVSHAVRPEVGLVGAKLLYPDMRIQHAGTAVGRTGSPSSHVWRHASDRDPGYLDTLSIVHNMSAVTGACFVLRKAVFHEVGGLDAVTLRVGANDTDFCFRIRAHGYRIILTPFARLIHAEGATRGTDDETPEKAERWRREQVHLTETWHALLDDPYHNPNLTRFSDRAMILPRSPVVRPWQRGSGRG